MLFKLCLALRQVVDGVVEGCAASLQLPDVVRVHENGFLLDVSRSFFKRGLGLTKVGLGSAEDLAGLAQPFSELRNLLIGGYRQVEAIKSSLVPIGADVP